MRQRITFVHEPEDALDPQLLKVTNDALSVTGNLKAAREDRITFGFSELPQELYIMLKNAYELHIRWASEEQYSLIPPMVSRVSPGLHAFYTPQRNYKGPDHLCPTLKKVFGDLDCSSPEDTFTRLPVERFSHSAAQQYFQPLSDIKEFVTYVQQKLCSAGDSSCLSRVDTLRTASSIDIGFDTISHALTINALWSPRHWESLALSNKGSNDRVEVGILSNEHATEPEELSLGGFLTVVGEDSKPSPTLFSFPARHHPQDAHYSTCFLLPSGLHPTMQLQISSNTPPTTEKACSIHAHLTLPRAIFPDKYQLVDPIFMASKNLSKVRHVTKPIDLEAPEYTQTIWGSSLLVELAPPESNSDIPWTADIPLHLRYLLPSSGTEGIMDLNVPWPVVFWACTADEGSKFPINPFDRVNLGYDGLFGPKTMFYHLEPSGDRLVSTLKVPVLDLDRSRWVEAGTALAVTVGFLWICWCALGVWKKNGYGSLKKQKAEKKTQ